MSLRPRLRLLARIKKLIARHRVLDNYCKDCGRKTENFHVEQSLWDYVVDPDRELCLRCFARLARRRRVWQTLMISAEKRQ